jgi:hypothetical protein
VAESEASGDSDYTGEFRLDDPVDTDRLAIQLPEGFSDAEADPEREPTADGFGYLFDDPADDAPVLEDAATTDIVWEDAHPVVPEPVGFDEERFDAFDANTWNFKAAPLPWYRTQGAVTAIVAVSVAVVALVVSVVLLAFRGPEGTEDETPAPETSSTPTTAATTPEDTSALPPPPPPPPETSAPPAPPPPVYNRPRSEPRESKQPEIGVTRTPITRSPISVAPQPRQGSQRR